MQPVKQFTTTELFKLFDEPTKLKAEENVALAPVQSILLDMVNENKITKQEIEKYSILFYYMSFEELWDTLSDTENEKDYENANNNTIVIISTLIDNNIMQLDFEDLCSRMNNRNFTLIDEQYSDYTETSTICVFINNDSKASKNILKFIHINKDEKKEDKKMDKDDFYYDYYVTYSIAKDVGANGIFKEDKALVIRSQSAIMSSEDVSSVVIQLAQKENVDSNQIFLYGFSLMNILDGIESLEDETEEKEEIKTFLEDQIGTFSSIYVFSIHYKQNGELKELQNATNIDITADDETKLELAESLVRDQDSVSDEDEIEIVEITKLADGGI